MPAFKDYTGTRKGRLLITERGGKRGSQTLWKVRCDCGTEKVLTLTNLLGKVLSCGCIKSETNRARLTTHGKDAKGARSRIYSIWRGMLNRCGNPNQPNYERYGGRGIKVCDRWKKFEDFYADMGDPPTDKHTIERNNNDLGYEPSNCRWATYLEQAQNKRMRAT